VIASRLIASDLTPSTQAKPYPMATKMLEFTTMSHVRATRHPHAGHVVNKQHRFLKPRLPHRLTLPLHLQQFTSDSNNKLSGRSNLNSSTYSSELQLWEETSNSSTSFQEPATTITSEVSVHSGDGGGAWDKVPPLQHDMGVTLIVLFGGYAWVRLFDFLTKQQILDQKLSRKLVHITSGLLFALCWPLYSNLPSAQYTAALVPLSNGIRLFIYGLGFLRDEGLVKSVSREGDPRELLRGPLYYVIVLIFSTVLFWRDSPVGVLVLAMMCGGDGIADIVGRSFGSMKLPWNKDKSYAGSVAMFVFGFLVSFACLWYFSVLGFYVLDVPGVVVRLGVVSLAATLVESLPVSTKLDDNVTVPLTTVVVGMLLFPASSPVLGVFESPF
jgi:phytol kinase